MKRQIIIEFDDEEVMKCPNGPDGEPGVLSITPDEVKTIYKNCYKIAAQVTSLEVNVASTIPGVKTILQISRSIRESIHNISSTMHDVEERN